MGWVGLREVDTGYWYRQGWIDGYIDGGTNKLISISSLFFWGGERK